MSESAAEGRPNVPPRGERSSVPPRKGRPAVRPGTKTRPPTRGSRRRHPKWLIYSLLGLAIAVQIRTGSGFIDPAVGRRVPTAEIR